RPRSAARIDDLQRHRQLGGTAQSLPRHLSLSETGSRRLSRPERSCGTDLRYRGREAVGFWAQLTSPSNRSLTSLLIISIGLGLALGIGMERWECACIFVRVAAAASSMPIKEKIDRLLRSRLGQMRDQNCIVTISFA